MWKKQKPQSATTYLQLESRIGKDSNMFVKFITAQEIFIFYKVEILSDQNMFLGLVYGLSGSCSWCFDFSIEDECCSQESCRYLQFIKSGKVKWKNFSLTLHDVIRSCKVRWEKNGDQWKREMLPLATVLLPHSLPLVVKVLTFGGSSRILKKEDRNVWMT